MKVLDSAVFIEKNAEHVKLGSDKEFQEAARIIEPLILSQKATKWADFPLHPSELKDPEKKAAYVFLIDSMNFAFWSEEGEPLFCVTFEGKLYSGYYSLCAAIKRAILEDDNILKPSFWVNSTLNFWTNIFRSETETPMPFLEWRVKSIQEAGRFVMEKFNGSVYEMINSTKKSAIALSELVSTNLESYKDMCFYKGKKVQFLKRAQILSGHLYTAFEFDDNYVADACKFTDLDKLTMFADYRVPQALIYLKLLHYDEYLMNTLINNPHLDAGSELECEIRGCSIAAVEKLKQFLNIPNISAFRIDFVLWPYAKSHSEELQHIPIHKTRTMFY